MRCDGLSFLLSFSKEVNKTDLIENQISIQISHEEISLWLILILGGLHGTDKYTELDIWL